MVSEPMTVLPSVGGYCDALSLLHTWADADVGGA